MHTVLVYMYNVNPKLFADSPTIDKLRLRTSGAPPSPSVEVIFFQKRNGKQGMAKILSKSIYNICERKNYIAIDHNLRVNKPNNRSPKLNKHVA